MAFFLSPVLNEQQFDANGDPRAGALISTYLAGTLTAVTTYKTSTGTNQSNPIQLDSSGNYPNGTQLWLLGGFTYKFVITDSDGANSRTYDNITGVGDTNATPDQFPYITGTPTYINATSFSLVGDQTNDAQIQRRIRSLNNGGTIYSTITNSVFAAGITTVTVVNDSGVLDAGLSQVNYALLTPLNPSVPTTYAKSGANSDITSLSGFAAVTVQTFTSDGTYTKPAGVRNIVVEVQAPGGGGSGAASGDRGNGGAGGGYARKNFLASAVAATEAVTVPAGGAGGAAGANVGVAGATASFGSLLTATGGAGGVIGGSLGGGSAGGIGSLGDVNVRGGQGSNTAGSTYGGQGGASHMGGGTSESVGVAGQTGCQYGGGGGGGHGSGATARAGGAGGAAIVIVTEFY